MTYYNAFDKNTAGPYAAFGAAASHRDSLMKSQSRAPHSVAGKSSRSSNRTNGRSKSATKLMVSVKAAKPGSKAGGVRANGAISKALATPTGPSKAQTASKASPKKWATSVADQRGGKSGLANGKTNGKVEKQINGRAAQREPATGKRPTVSTANDALILGKSAASAKVASPSKTTASNKAMATSRSITAGKSLAKSTASSSAKFAAPTKSAGVTAAKSNGKATRKMAIDIRSAEGKAVSLRDGSSEHGELRACNGVLRPKRPSASGKCKLTELPPDYRPSDKDPFMGDLHRLYFRKKLQAWREEILRSTRETLQSLHDDQSHYADIADRATSESDKALELRARDRQRKLIAKIDAAIERIDRGTYGYCDETGEPIAVRRLDARPIATLSIEAQERHERRERVYRDD